MASSIQTIGNFLPELKSFLEDENVSEVMLNGNGSVYVEDLFGMKRLDVSIPAADITEAAIHIARINNKEIGAGSPIVDTRLEDGSRVAMVFPPCSVGGASISIRKFNRRFFSLDELILVGTLTAEQREILLEAVWNRENILIAGGTSTGKTSLLNAVANHVDQEHRVALIEDTAEIQINLPNLVRLESRNAAFNGAGESISKAVTHSDLLRSALRLRPDRIIVGEIRGIEAYDLLQALNTGHAGSMSTIHANGPIEALNRLGSLALMALPEMSHKIVQRDIQTALSVVVHLVKRGGARVVDSIQRISGYESLRKQFVLVRLDTERKEN